MSKNGIPEMGISFLNSFTKVKHSVKSLELSGALLEESNHRKMDVNSSAKSVSYGAVCVDSVFRQVESKKSENVTYSQKQIFLLCRTQGVGLLQKGLTHYHRHMLSQWRFINFSGSYSH